MEGAEKMESLLLLLLSLLPLLLLLLSEQSLFLGCLDRVRCLGWRKRTVWRKGTVGLMG